MFSESEMQMIASDDFLYENRSRIRDHREAQSISVVTWESRCGETAGNATKQKKLCGDHASTLNRRKACKWVNLW